MDTFEIDQNKLDSFDGMKWNRDYRPLVLLRFQEKNAKFGCISLKQGYVSSRFVTVVFLEVDNLSGEINGRYDPNANVDLASIQLFGYSIPSLIYNDEEILPEESSII
eukprot:CAMPEP_0205801914 /NCGR_PEP_ID=MMETSP0205-20121125/4076_1 /ASSEMBLY_ACC=CAM_ASM_000278 /TAXON_ID=36767 /ORGANISM="Euplotes focardii, Strain TN1" /LENGTH=107 /DNA_ID=CAMNT_0053067485 /DNA_START=464 /DNA_END=784 /DNA_ORIENTATION=-